MACANDLQTYYSFHRLPLDVVMLVISELLPKVQELQASRKTNSASAIMDLLSTINLKHILPQAPAMSLRRFTVRLNSSRFMALAYAFGSGQTPR
jgi:hypothetical protein